MPDPLTLAHASADAARKAAEAADAAAVAANAVVIALEDTPEPPDPPTPEPGAGLVYGYSHTNRDKLEKASGVLVCADRIFEGGTPSSWGSTAASKLPARYFPFLSVKAGSWTSPPAAAFESLIRGVNRPMVIIPNHEPENDGKKPADFVALVTRYAEIVAKVANPHVELAINLMTSWAGKTTAQGGSAAYIPDPKKLAVPCGLTWDGYRPAGKASQSPDQIYADPWRLTKDAGFAWWGIMETACETNAKQWVKDVTTWAEGKGARAVCYWPSQVSDGTKPNYYPPASAMPAFAEVALKYGGKRL